MTTDDELFREAMADVDPLPRLRQRELPADPAARQPTARQRERQRAAEGRSGTAQQDPNPLTLRELEPLHPREVLAWKKDGVQHEVFSRLKSGSYEPEGQLDLHRSSVREARVKVFEFLELAARRGWRTLLIAHGRGEQSSTPARLKTYVNHWLREWPQVNAYHSAARHHGGTGAVYVLLKKTREAKEATRERFGQQSEPEDLPRR